MVFVLGGVSLLELRELRQLIAQFPKHTLLIGATCLTSPDVVWEMLTAGVQIQ